MPLINREGRFKATIREAGVSETGQNRLVTFTAGFNLIEEYDAAEGAWRDIADEGNEITEYFYLERKDGSVNSRTIDSLCEALGWDGRDPFWLQDTDLSSVVVQLTIAMETYENKTRPKVKWINHENSKPTSGVQRAEGAARTAIANRFGARLRANAGGTPRPAPAPTAPAPTAPKAPAPTPAAPRTSTADEAWAVFCEACAKCANSPSDADRERQWFRILGELFPGKEVGAFTPADWAKVAEEAPGSIIPF